MRGRVMKVGRGEVGVAHGVWRSTACKAIALEEVNMQGRLCLAQQSVCGLLSVRDRVIRHAKSWL